MKNLSRKARGYILTVILAGAVLFAFQLPLLPRSNSWLLLGICALSSLAQVLKVEGPTHQSSYNISWVLYGFAFLLFGTPGLLLVMLVGHLVEWVWHKYPWFIQCFNITSFAVAAGAAGAVYGWTNRAFAPSEATGLAALAGALAAFTLVNHLAVGLVLLLARGESFADSAVFSRLTLFMDFCLLGIGAGAALIWQINPFASSLAALPLYLIYTTLQVPALQRQASTDSKTGLFNARHFSRALEVELARANRFDRPLTVVMADLDLLRNINNTYGHLAGDVVLIGAARILKESVRDYDVVARFGGEEFAVLMPETTPEQALPHIEAIRSAIQSARFDVSTSLTPIQITMSFGVAGREGINPATNEILHNSDLAVYQAKLDGRNLIRLHAVTSPNPPLAEAVLAAAVAPGVGPSPANGNSPFLPPTESPAEPDSVAGPEETPASPPPAKARPLWMVNVYIVGVAAVAGLGFLLAVLHLPSHQPVEWAGIAIFAAIVFFSEWLAVDIYIRDTSVSTATAPLIAGALLLGPYPTLLFCLLLAVAAFFKHRSSVNRLVFNTGNHLLAGLLAQAPLLLLGGPTAKLSIPAQIGLSIVGCLVAYLSTTSLIALAIHLDSGQSFRVVWEERFRWLAPYYLALGIVAYSLVFSYVNAGPFGLLIMMVPLFMLRFSQQQYIDHTRNMVSQVRATNVELVNRANEISSLNEELLLALSGAIDMRDPYVLGHSQHVSRYAVLLAQELRLPPARTEQLRKAGLLHDIGKLGIAESILFKPASLSPLEYAAVKEHVTCGADLLEGCRSLQALIPFIRHHHEQVDGNGYPDGLRGAQIPLESRILSLADAVEAMASDRPYRQGMDSREILEEIHRFAGTQFDAEVVSAFARVVQRGGRGVIVNSARNIPLRRLVPDFGSSESGLSTIPLSTRVSRQEAGERTPDFAPIGS